MGETYIRDEDRTKEELIEALRGLQQARMVDINLIDQLRDRVDRLTEELTRTKRALAYNCEALKASIGWEDFNIKGE